MLSAIQVSAKPSCFFTAHERPSGYGNIMFSNEGVGHVLNMSTQYLSFSNIYPKSSYFAVVQTKPTEGQVFSLLLNLPDKNREIMSTIRNSKLVEDKNKIIPEQLISNSIEGYFNYLYDNWQNETKFISFFGNNTNEYYKNIIGLGKLVVPYIINKLRKEPCHLFIALSEITGKNPVKQEHQGLIHEMATDWISWWDMNNHAVE